MKKDDKYFVIFFKIYSFHFYMNNVIKKFGLWGVGKRIWYLFTENWD